MPALNVRGCATRRSILRRVTARLLLTIGVAIPSAATAGDAGNGPGTSRIAAAAAVWEPLPVMQGLLQVRHVLQVPDQPPPAPPAENEPAPIRPVPTRQVPALLQLPTDPSQPDTAPPTPDYELEPLRQAAIQVAAPSTYVNYQGTASTLELPDNHGAAVFANSVDLRGAENGWFETVSAGHVACVDYHPLYFEELTLERYGDHFGCWQPLVSAFHFYGAVPLLPYKLVASPPCGYESSCQYPSAATPAGRISCLQPINLKGAAFEVGVVAAAILLVP